MLWYPEEGWLCRLSKTDFQRKGPEVASCLLGWVCLWERELAQAQRSPNWLRRHSAVALMSWVVVAVGISLIGDLAVSRTRHAVWGREGGGHCWKSVRKGPTS